LLVQIHTRKISFRTKVLDIASPVYSCGIGQETLAHVAAYCLREEVSRVTIRDANRDFEAAINANSAVVHEEEDMGVERRKRTIPPPTYI
jgi:hypothetical protein